MTGGRVSKPEQIKDCLVQQIVSSVRFENCLRNMAAENELSDFYECGPGKVLAGFAKRTDKALTVTPISEYEEIPG